MITTIAENSPMQIHRTLPKGVDRDAVLAQIRAAKSAHMRWRSYAQAIISGVEIEENKVPVRHTDCTFGKWYYGEGQKLLGHLDAYQAIATPHKVLHAIYERIYQTIHKEEKKGLSRLWHKESPQARKVQAREHLDELIGASETLLKTLDILEQEIRNAEG